MHGMSWDVDSTVHHLLLSTSYWAQVVLQHRAKPWEILH